MLERLAPQVGLEPTTLRLTARIVPRSALPIIALCCAFSVACKGLAFIRKRRDCSQFCAFFKRTPYKSPYSRCRFNECYADQTLWIQSALPLSN